MSDQAKAVHVNARRVTSVRSKRVDHRTDVVASIHERLLAPLVRLPKRRIRTTTTRPRSATPSVLVVRREYPVAVLCELLGEKLRLYCAPAKPVRENHHRLFAATVSRSPHDDAPPAKRDGFLRCGTARKHDEGNRRTGKDEQTMLHDRVTPGQRLR